MWGKIFSPETPAFFFERFHFSPDVASGLGPAVFGDKDEAFVQAADFGMEEKPAAQFFWQEDAPVFAFVSDEDAVLFDGLYREGA